MQGSRLRDPARPRDCLPTMTSPWSPPYLGAATLRRFRVASGRSPPHDRNPSLGGVSVMTPTVEAKGLEPSNLLTASQALYQLSYAPEGRVTLSAPRQKRPRAQGGRRHRAGHGRVMPGPNDWMAGARGSCVSLDRRSGTATRVIVADLGFGPGTIIGNGTGLRRHRHREEMAAPL